MKCPHCQSEQSVKNARVKMRDQSLQQRYLCGACSKRFTERTHTQMARLRTPAMVVSAAINLRTEGLGVRATGRSFGKSHSTIMRWEHRVAEQGSQWSPPAPNGTDLTLEGDEVYTHVGENLPPCESQGWTIHLIERDSRYWVDAQSGQKTTELFEQGTTKTWEWAKRADFIRFCST